MIGSSATSPTPGTPFSRFMSIALYEPGLGYYERDPSIVGPPRDLTAVSIGPFGELLAFQIATWLDGPGMVPSAGSLQLVETGATMDA